MKLRVETSRDGGTIVEFEGEGALDLAKRVVEVLVPGPAVPQLIEVVAPAPAPLRVTDWGQRRIDAIKEVRALWGMPLKDAKELTERAPVVLELPSRGHSRTYLVECLRAAGVEVE